MRYSIQDGDASTVVDIDLLSPGRYRVKVGDGPTRLVDGSVGARLVHLHLEGQSHAMHIGHGKALTHIGAQGRQAALEILDPRVARLRARKGGGGRAGSADQILSPMPGRIVKVMVAVGDSVTAGQGVVIVEAMKMENELRVERDGVVESVAVKADNLVEANAVLIRLVKVESEDE